LERGVALVEDAAHIDEDPAARRKRQIYRAAQMWRAVRWGEITNIMPLLAAIEPENATADDVGRSWKLDLVVDPFSRAPGLIPQLSGVLQEVLAAESDI
jgi:hypothetical protein